MRKIKNHLNRDSPTPNINTNQSYEKYLAIFILMAGLFYVVIARWHMLPAALERDEGEFGYIAQLIIKGENPFEAYNYKLPGTSLVYAFFFSFLGDSPAAVHVGLMICNLITVFLVFLLARQYTSHKLISAFASFFYGLATLDIGVQGMSAHATQFLNMFSISGLILLKDSGKVKSDLIFFSGILMGLAFLMKQNAAFMILFGIILIIADALYSQKFRCREVLIKILIYSTGSIIPFLLVLFWSISFDSLDSFWRWTFIYPLNYAGLNSFSNGINNFKDSVLFVTDKIYPLYLLGLSGIITSFWDKGKKVFFFLSAYLVLSFFSVAQGMYFRNHYYVLIVPAIMISAAWFMGFISKKIPIMYRMVFQLAAFLVLVFWIIIEQKESLFKLSPEKYISTHYAGNSFNEAVMLGDFIKNRTDLKDKIAVLGSEAEIYFYAKRKAAVGYLFMYDIVRSHRFTSLWQEELLNQLLKNKPKMIVWVNHPITWLPESETLINPIINALNNQVVAGYHPVLIMDMIGPDETIIKQGEELFNYYPQSENHFLVFERNN